MSALDAVLKPPPGAGAGAGGAEELPAGKPVTGAAEHRSTDTVMWLLLVVESYRRAVGRPLLSGFSITEIADQVWGAPFVLLSHTCGEGEEPTFNYANSAALELFETAWDGLVGSPSTQSAEDDADVQADRQRLLDEAREKGFVEGYSGWRVSAEGKRFLVQDAILFNVVSPSEKTVGQAVVFTSWEYEDGSRGSTVPEEEVGDEAAGALGGEELLERARSAAAEQGDAVRALKESGLGNNDPEVQAAVEILLERKRELEALEEKYDGAPK